MFSGVQWGAKRGRVEGGDGHGCPRKAASASTLGGVSLQSPDQKNAITMLSDRILVQIPTEGERTSRSGILIPATAQVARRLSWAEVVATGPLVRSVGPGHQVLFHREEAFDVEVRGEEYLILRERDIHAVASPKDDEEGTGLYL